MTTALEVFLRSRFDATGIDNAVKKLNTLGVTAQDLQHSLGGIENISQVEINTEAIERQIKVLNESSAAWQRAAQAAFQRGQFDIARIFQSESNSLRNLASTFNEQLNPSVDLAHKLMNMLGGVINNKVLTTLNRFGFALFITQSSIRTVTELVNDLIGVFEKAAATTDRFRSFTVLLNQAGIEATAMQERLKDAGRGAVSMNVAIGRTIQLLKAQLPEAAESSDKLLEIATASAIVSGELDQVDTIFQKLVRGIVRGSPRLIDDADIILKLGDANEQYAASIGKTVEELTAREKAIATFEAVQKEGEAIIKMADAVDSTALRFKQFRVSIEETGSALQRVVGEGVDALFDLDAGVRASFGEMAGEILEFLGTGQKFAEDTKVLFKSTADFIKIMAALAGGAIKGLQNVVDELLEPSREMVDIIIQQIKGFKLLFEVMRTGKLDSAAFKQLLEDTGKEMGDFIGSITDVEGHLIGMAEGMVEGMESVNELAIAFGVAEGEARKFMRIIGPFQDFFQQVEEAKPTFFKDLVESLKDTPPEIEFGEKILESQQKFDDTIAKIREKLGIKLTKIDSDTNARIKKIAEDRTSDLLKIDEDLQTKLLDINKDLAIKLGDINEDANDRRADAKRKSTKALQKIEEDHQSKIDKIMRKFELSRLKALIDRDARALFEAQQRRDEELRNLEEDTDKSKKSELDKLREKLDDIDRAEKRRMRDAEKNARRRIRDAEIAAARAREQRMKQFEQQYKDSIAQQKRLRQAAREAAKLQEADEVRSFVERGQSIHNWYQEQLAEQERANAIQRLEYLNDLMELKGMTDEILQEWLGVYNDFFSDRNDLFRMGALTPQFLPDGATPPGGNGGGNNTGGTIPPSQIRSGVSCNARSGVGYTGEDGRIYLCVNGRWVPQEDVIPSSRTSEVLQTTNMPNAPEGRSGNTQVVLQSNDGAFQDFLNQVVSDAFIQIME